MNVIPSSCPGGLFLFYTNLGNNLIQNTYRSSFGFASYRNKTDQKKKRCKSCKDGDLKWREKRGYWLIWFVKNSSYPNKLAAENVGVIYLYFLLTTFWCIGHNKGKSSAFTESQIYELSEMLTNTESAFIYTVFHIHDFFFHMHTAIWQWDLQFREFSWPNYCIKYTPSHLKLW